MYYVMIREKDQYLAPPSSAIITDADTLRRGTFVTACTWKVNVSRSVVRAGSPSAGNPLAG